MQDLGKMFSLLGTMFLVLGLLSNLIPKFPKIPGDIYINKPNIKIYIPWLSSLIIAVILTVMFNYFRK